MHLQITNGIAAGYAAITSSNATYLIARPARDKVRVQVTVHAEGAEVAVCLQTRCGWRRKTRDRDRHKTVAVTSPSWLTQALTDYQVVYKDDLSNPTWTPIGGLVCWRWHSENRFLCHRGGKRFTMC